VGVGVGTGVTVGSGVGVTAEVETPVGDGAPNAGVVITSPVTTTAEPAAYAQAHRRSRAICPLLGRSVCGVEE
jgi:hypothetical protein